MNAEQESAPRNAPGSYLSWLGQDMPALPIDLFRAFVGCVLAAYFTRHLLQAASWFGSERVLDVAFVHRAFPITCLSLFQPHLPLWCARSIWGLAIVLSLAIAAGVHVRACAAASFAVAVSGLRSLYVVSYIDDYFVTCLAFWLILLPSGATLRLRDLWDPGARERWARARVPGAAVRFFLANIGLIYLDAGLWKLTSAFWRDGFALFAILHMPIAYHPELAPPSWLPLLRVANALALGSELSIPLLLLAPARLRLRRLAIPLSLGLHVFILLTVRVPFINLVLPASLLVFFRDELMQFVSRGALRQSALPARAFGLAEVCALGYVFVLGLSLLAELPPFVQTGAAAHLLVDQLGLTQNYRLFDWVDRRNVQWDDVVAWKPGPGKTRQLDAALFWPSGIRAVLLRSYLADSDWQFIPRAVRGEMLGDVRARLARRFCRDRKHIGGVSVAARPTALTPENLKLEPGPETVLLRFECARDGSATNIAAAESTSAQGLLLSARSTLEFPRLDDTRAHAGSGRCVECHTEAARHWRASAHANSMAPAARAAILGAFGNAVDANGARATAHEENGKFVLDVANASNRARCIECHASGTEYRLSESASRLEWRESDVGCEECHGASAAHVEVATRGGTGEAPPALRILSKTASLRLCGRCHGLSAPFDSRASGSHLPERAFATLANAAFRPDASARLRDAYQYAQVLVSECYQAGGATCVTCHGAHDSAVGPTAQPARSVCTQCHQQFGTAERQLRHSRHQGNVQCIDCHMPRFPVGDGSGAEQLATNHTISIPRPREALDHGVPNACTNCHRERDARWALDALAVWGKTRALESRVWVKTLAAAEQHVPDQFEALLALVRSEQREPILGAALRFLSDYPSDARAISTLRPLAEHADPAVRAAALGALIRHDPANALEWRARGTGDPSPFVRMIAFEAEPDPRRLSEREKQDYLRDVLESALLPLPRAVVHLAQLRASLGELEASSALLRLAQRMALAPEAERLRLRDMIAAIESAAGAAR